MVCQKARADRCVSSFGLVFNGFVEHSVQVLRKRGSVHNGQPVSYKAHIEHKARVQYEAYRRAHELHAEKKSVRNEFNYDQTKDDVPTVDLTGANAVQLGQFRSNQKKKGGPWAEFGLGLTQDSEELTDEERLYRLNEIVLTRFQYQPFIFQKRFFRIILRCIAQLVVGEDTWNRRGAAIMKHFGWDTIGTMAIATSFRRGGKTQIVCYALAAACLVKSLVAGFFSTAKRASDGARNTFIKALQTSDFAHCLPTIGLKAEILYIAAIYDKAGSVSAISFYPANPRIRPLLSSLYSDFGLTCGRRWMYRCCAVRCVCARDVICRLDTLEGRVEVYCIMAFRRRATGDRKSVV